MDTAISTRLRETRLGAPLPNPLRWTLAIYQLIAAGWLLTHQTAWILAPTTTQIPERLLAGTLLTLSLLAGIFLLRNAPLGPICTLLNQLTQLFAFASPAFTYVARLGLAATVRLYGTPPTGGPGTGYFGVELGWQWGNTSDLALGRPHPDHPGYLLSVNTLAAVIIIVTLVYSRKPTQSAP
jgi:hypothetical protein